MQRVKLHLYTAMTVYLNLGVGGSLFIMIKTLLKHNLTHARTKTGMKEMHKVGL